MILKEKAGNMQLLEIAGIWNKIVARFCSILFLARQKKNHSHGTNQKENTVLAFLS